MKKQAPAETKQRSRRLRREMTDAERRLWPLLSHRQLKGVKFRRQVPLGPYIVDFASHEAKLVVELDGGQHGARYEYDGDRTAFLNEEGYRVLRFWNNDVLKNPEGVLMVIADALSYRSGDEDRYRGGA